MTKISSNGKRRVYDVSMTLFPGMLTYPRDPGIEVEVARSIDSGDSVNLTLIRMGSHTGTHCDAPRHMLADGPTLDDVPLDRLIGPARVLQMGGDSIDGDSLKEHDLAKVSRVLFKTRNSEHLRETEFYADYVYLAISGAEYLINAGVELVGIDYLSIERFGDRAHEVHKSLLKSGLTVIEGLDLSQIAPGDYEIIALPLKIRGSEGAPTRVVLRGL